MNKIKKTLESIRQYVSPKTRALEQELDAVRKAHEAVNADLEEVRKNLQRDHEDDAQRLAELQQQLGQIETERNSACGQIEHLKRALADAEQRQISMEADIGSLVAKLEEERSKARMQVEQLEHALADAVQRHKATESDVSVLGVRLEEERSNARIQVEHLESALADAVQHHKSIETDVSLLGAKLEEERSNARMQVEHLEHALTEAEQRQKSTEAHVGLLVSRIEDERGNARKQVEHLERALAGAEQRQQSMEAHVASLEAMLREERDAHEAGIQATETFLARMQSEQESQLKLQSEQVDTLQDVAIRLRGALQLHGNKPQSSLLKLMVTAVVLFLTGTLAGIYILQSRQDEDRKLAAVERDIRDMGAYVKQHIDNQEAMMNDIALALNRPTIGGQAMAEDKPAVPGAETQEAETQPQKVMTFEPDIRELQTSLIALGFDLGIPKSNGEPGIKTRQALEEFGQFYLPQGDAQDDVVSEPLAALILKSADRARADAARFNIGSDVLAAIRLGSIRTGVDFSFLMELARVESNFDPTARAPRSSATGLFQFKDYSWLEAIRTFGADYGLKDYATRVKPISDENHEQKPIVRDPLQLEVLALRLNPRLSTLMVAEEIKRNLQILSARTGHEPGRTELYLAHYFGPEGAVKFLKTLDEAPATIAGDIFPEEAASNPQVFQGGQHQPRTVADVYRVLDRKFNTARYDEHNPG